MLMPFGTAFIVNNVGLAFSVLPIIYLVTGLFTIFVGPLVGKASDSFGKFPVFCAGSLVTLILVPVWTNIGHVPLALVIVINVTLFVGIFSRIIPSQALISGDSGTRQARGIQRHQCIAAAVRGRSIGGGARDW